MFPHQQGLRNEPESVARDKEELLPGDCLPGLIRRRQTSVAAHITTRTQQLTPVSIITRKTASQRFHFKMGDLWKSGCLHRNSSLPFSPRFLHSHPVIVKHMLFPLHAPSDSFRQLLGSLASQANGLDAGDAWPAVQLQQLGQANVYRWFVPPLANDCAGGEGWTEAELLKVYIALAKACLTTAFILTQRQAAVSRIVASENEWLRQRLLPGLLSGESFATVGIAQLTTSRRHLARPVLRMEQIEGGLRLDGLCPWVTVLGMPITSS